MNNIEKLWQNWIEIKLKNLEKNILDKTKISEMFWWLNWKDLDNLKNLFDKNLLKNNKNIA